MGMDAAINKEQTVGSRVEPYRGSMRRRRFPLFSTLILLALAAAILYMSYLDVDLPKQAMEQVGAAVNRLGQSFALMGHANGEGGGFVFSADYATPVPEDPLPMLVNSEHPVPEGYMPVNLVRMREYCDERIVYIKGSEIDGERTAVDALMVMLQAAIDEGISDWQISAGYRSVAYQQQVWDNQVYTYRQDGLSSAQAQTATAKYVAKPGCSEHHTGLAFDVTVPGQSFPLTQQSKWLAEHCWDYGFIIRYTEEKVDITGINAEPWHIRYVGQPHATRMRDNGWCLEEYIEAMGE